MTPSIKNILYPSDLGPHMRPVFRFAVDLARRYEAKIIMLHVLEPLSNTSRRLMQTYLSNKELDRLQEEGYRKVRKKMRKRLTKFCEDEMAKPLEECDMEFEFDVVSGTPAEMIRQEAEERGADLIVMGTHSNPSLGHRLLGSTARKLTHMSRVPVLVVPIVEND